MNNIDNKLYGAVGILQDLSHFEPIIKELDTYKKLAHQLDAIFESCQDGLYLTDGDGYTLRVNTAYEKMIGFKREDLIGKHISWLEEKGLISESVTLQVLTSKTAVSRIQKLANQKEILVTGTPVKNEEENISLVVHHARDITYLKALEAEVEKARESNETFSRGISQFRFGSPVEAEFPLQSEAMKEIVRRIRRISLFPTFVLLQGETGVGKEVIASMIHHYSPRAKKPFIKVNCSALPENLLESELFGYEKGAFSGAHPNGKPGLFELAVGGTILLDEIGDLPLNLQAKLLRVIQERELRRVGSTKTIPIDIRVISATNKDLKKLVKIGQFREDLYYRLNVIDIHIPPLRQRIEDIPLLLDYYMHKYGKEYGIKKRIAPDTLDCLRSYHWPGNIRELRNLLENLIVSTTSFEILPTHLPDCMKNQPEPQYLAAKEPETITLLSDERNHHGGLKQALEQVEYAMIQNALHKHGSIRQAAASLQIDHSTLIRKMRNLKICKP